MRLIRLQNLKINGRAPELIRLIPKIVVKDLEVELGGGAAGDGGLEELVPGRMERFLLDFGLVDVLAVQFEFAVGVAEAVAVGGREVGGVEDVDAQGALVVDAFRRVETHVNGNVFERDADFGLATTFAIEGEFGSFVLIRS